MKNSKYILTSWKQTNKEDDLRSACSLSELLLGGKSEEIIQHYLYNRFSRFLALFAAVFCDVVLEEDFIA